jgi:hypothetical protein
MKYESSVNEQLVARVAIVPMCSSPYSRWLPTRSPRQAWISMRELPLPQAVTPG